MQDWLVRQSGVQKYEQLSQREKLLVLGALTVTIFLSIKSLGFGRLDLEQRQLEAQSSQLAQSQQQLQAQLQVFSEAAGHDPDRAQRRRLDGLNRELKKLDESLTRLSVGLIPAQQLPMLLRQVLASSEDLTLEQIRTRPVSELTLTGDVVDESAIFAEEEESAGVYKHSVVVTLQGGYFDIKDYLIALEALPWRLYWESLSYDVLDYPRARVVLEVYTLSTDRGVFNE